MSYNVTFEYTEAAGGYAGVRTWTSFPSKEYFDKWYTDDLKANERVIEEGVSEERCLELTSRTPAASRIAAAKQKAGGDPDMLVFTLASAFFVILNDAARNRPSKSNCEECPAHGSCDGEEAGRC